MCSCALPKESDVKVNATLIGSMNAEFAGRKVRSSFRAYCLTLQKMYPMVSVAINIEKHRKPTPFYF